MRIRNSRGLRAIKQASKHGERGKVEVCHHPLLMLVAVVAASTLSVNVIFDQCTRNGSS